MAIIKIPGLYQNETFCMHAKTFFEKERERKKDSKKEKKRAIIKMISK